MDLDELDDKLDSLPINRQLKILLRNITEAKKKLEISNLFWARVLAAEELMTPDEAKLFDAAADALIQVRTLVGYRPRRRRKS